MDGNLDWRSFGSLKKLVTRKLVVFVGFDNFVE
jgi:hypothetical protein